ncbi:MAG: IS630 family transposase [Planctomycetota bacterium]|nr:MAG: IS630 family transposase [Planctomycetota bacterium]
MDESTFYLLTKLTRILAPKGSKPIQLVNSTKKKVVAYGTIDENGKAECFFFENMKSESFIEFLEILKNIYGKYVLVLDGAPSHRSKKTKGFIEEQKGDIILEFLPRYSPDMNPVEEVWKQSKREVADKFFEYIEQKREFVFRFIEENDFNLNISDYLCK